MQGKKLLRKIQNLKHSVQIVRSFIFQIHSGFPDETILTRFNPHSGLERNLHQLMVFRDPKALYVIKVTLPLPAHSQNVTNEHFADGDEKDLLLQAAPTYGCNIDTCGQLPQ